ncbi:hypothetical protein CUMW_239980, partial [Citrus unshiu]
MLADAFSQFGHVTEATIIMDKDNLVENLLGDFEFEVQVPYLLYRNASQEVNGIWFYNARECEEVANLFSRRTKQPGELVMKPSISCLRISTGIMTWAMKKDQIDDAGKFQVKIRKREKKIQWRFKAIDILLAGDLLLTVGQTNSCYKHVYGRTLDIPCKLALLVGTVHAEQEAISMDPKEKWNSPKTGTSSRIC